MTDTTVAGAAAVPGSEPPSGDVPVIAAGNAPAFPGRRRTPLLRGRGLTGLILVAAVIVAGVAAPLLAPYAPEEQIRNANLLGPSWQHLLGTDEVNRDVLSRTLYGIRVDALIVFIAVPAGAVLGSLAGVVSSQFAVADVVTQRVFDVLLAFPALILAIGLTAVTGPGAVPIGVVVVALELPLFGRLVRTATLAVRELPFVRAAEAMGAPRSWVLRRHVLPNVAEPVLVQLALSMSGAVFIDSAMNFIGIGVRPPTPSLGSVLAASVANLHSNPMYAVGPLIVIAVLVLGCQLIAQALTADRRRAGA
ncbi:ABC transporter permease [Planotetraspora phitsanulokensis]|uniref:Diguanylate cyclase n=1 Tax=Planotetraspora phitsanulokensis TaxID=575192 RepID=A0A8J3US11_9ACTN|nr:ABC transporter permease [Planotetraspora phitsanulokensis]GII43545.1 diguanylate cyclase [Planotetraspora phitsanulokensis]